MAVSGVRCQQDVIDKYNQFKKATSNIAFMVCKIQDGMIIIEEAPEYGVGDIGEKDALDDKGVPVVYQKLEKLCLDGGCRYAFFTFKWTTNGGNRDSIVFIQFCDDNCASSKDKLLYSTSKNAVVKPCNGINTIVEANDKEEISYAEVLKEAKKNKR